MSEIIWAAHLADRTHPALREIGTIGDYRIELAESRGGEWFWCATGPGIDRCLDNHPRQPLLSAEDAKFDAEVNLRIVNPKLFNENSRPTSERL